LAGHYFATLSTDPPCALPATAWPGEPEGHSWNMFCVLLPLDRMTITRKQFIDAMEQRGVGIGISYEAMHLSTLFRKEGHIEGEFPNSERIARETVTLPLHPTMTKADVERVCREVTSVISQNSKGAG
jgi:dTDP-4-amino-4,6-dideoxygalactose transaminase